MIASALKSVAQSWNPIRKHVMESQSEKIEKDNELAD